MAEGTTDGNSLIRQKMSIVIHDVEVTGRSSLQSPLNMEDFQAIYGDCRPECLQRTLEVLGVPNNETLLKMMRGKYILQRDTSTSFIYIHE